MWNTFAGSFQLANIQVFGRKRRLVTIIVFLLPLAMAILLRNIGPRETNEAYAQVVSGMLAVFLVPFIAVFWGSALLTDEVEGKTLVFLWTRPAGRSRLFVFKYLGILAWLLLLCAVAVTTTYAVIYSRVSFLDVMSNWMVIIWDTRALAIGTPLG